MSNANTSSLPEGSLAPAPPSPAADPPPLLPDAASVAPAPECHPFIFHGDEREYFRIWIVNTFLTLLTGGVYAAWAKVRKRRYLRGSTELLGHRFDYLASPPRLLIGNLLVALIFVAYMVVGEVYPKVRGGAFLVGLVLLPWVIARSLAFNAHNTAYRGMRFYFRQPYGMTFLVFIGQWFFIFLTLGWYYPAWVRNVKEFTISHHRLGDAFFRFESKSGPFYSAYLLSGLIVFAAAAAGGLISAAILAGHQGRLPTTAQLIPFFVIYGFAIYLAKQLVYARVFNQVWNHTRLDQHRFIASLPTGGWLKMQIANLAAMIGSLGLLYPWAVIRSARYALAHLQFLPDRPIEKIARLGRSDGSAIGETAAEFIGLDFGL